MATRPKGPRPIGLSGLRGFEAAARLLSFTLAADELSLTQSSISRQIRTLETQIGRPLFHRRTRALELTPAGLALYEVVRASLDELDGAVADIRRGPRRGRVVVTTYASFATLILVPWLPRFSAHHPEIDIRIDASDEMRDLELDGIDIAIRLMRRDRAPRDATLLAVDVIVPVIAPTLLARVGPIERPADLVRATLLNHDYGPRNRPHQTWESWFDSLGESLPLDAASISMNYTHQALDAALQGQGVMLAPLFFARDALVSGALVEPLANRLDSPHGYFLIVNPQAAERPAVVAFSRWLVDEVTERNAGIDPPGAPKA